MSNQISITGINHTLSSLKKSGSTSIISKQAYKMENFAKTSIKHEKWHKEQRPTREGATVRAAAPKSFLSFSHQKEEITKSARRPDLFRPSSTSEDLMSRSWDFLPTATDGFSPKMQGHDEKLKTANL